MSSNTIELFEFNAKIDTPFQHQQTFDRIGHRSAARTVSISSDDAMILTGSSESVKIWNTANYQCLRSFETGFCTSSSFLPGDDLAVIGHKDGSLVLYDVEKAQILETIPAHKESIWSIHVAERTIAAEGVVIMTGSADRTVKMWQVVMNKKTNLLKLKEIRHMDQSEEIHCVKFSPDGKFYAIAYIDSNMMIYFADTNKHFLTMYGHKLPVLSLDISSDGTLLVSGSADKNVKLWGMDFGNCKRSLFAHQDSVMAVSFVRDTHYFFSVGRDKIIKYWDGDTYELILEFDNNLGEIWSIAVSTIGDFFVTVSNDKTVRFFEQTKDQVFLVEEEEKRMEKQMVDSYANEKLKNKAIEAGDGLTAATDVEKLRVDHLKHGENVIEAIENAEKVRLEFE